MRRFEILYSPTTLGVGEEWFVIYRDDDYDDEEWQPTGPSFESKADAQTFKLGLVTQEEASDDPLR